ncbi:MAG: hypothetical protein GX442_24640 [Candidatus Riflebacteria bacterium]|nr:hypothetical protein [Candidatus Riflebacteria bacterium]
MIPLQPGLGPHRVGGKGTALARAAAAGFRIPSTFVLPGGLFRSTFGAGPFLERWQAVAARVRAAAGPGEVVAAAGPLQAEAEEMLGNLDVGPILGALPDGPEWATLVVRSSADLEDLEEASGAGQLVSTVGVPREGGALARAVRAGWVAPFGAAFLSYAGRLGIDPTAVRLALLIQPQVAALWSGVAFSLDPLTARPAVVIEAVPGLPVGVTDGTATAHQPEPAESRHPGEGAGGPPNLEETGGRAGAPPATNETGATAGVADGAGESRAGPSAELGSRPGALRRWVIPLPGGDREEIVPPADLEPFGAGRLADLLRAVVRLGEVFGGPVDVEWAFDAVGLVILQVRPVTALGGGFPPGIEWTRALTAERYPFPLSPLGWSNIREVFDQGVRSFAAFMGHPLADKDQLACSVDGWIFANAAAFDFKSRFKVRLTAAEQVGLLGEVIPRLADGPGFWRNLRELKALVLTPGRLRTRLGNRLDSPVLALAGGAGRRYLARVGGEVRRAWPGVLARFRRRVAELSVRLETLEDWRELLATGDGLRAEMILYIKPDLVIFAIREIAAQMLVALARLAGLADPEGVPARLAAGLPENATLAFHRRLLDLHQELATCPGEDPAGWPEPARAAWEAFRREFGHLAPGWDLRFPTLGEDPARLLAMVRAATGRTGPRREGSRPDRPTGSSGLRGENSWPANPAGRSAATAGNAVPEGPGVEVPGPDRNPAAPPPPAGRWGAGAPGTTADDAWGEFARALERWPVARDLAAFLTDTLRAFLPIDEEHHFFTGLVFPPTRRLIGKLGDELVRRRCLAHPEDIYWLTDPEVRDLLARDDAPSLAGLVRQRRAAHQRAWRAGPPTPPHPSAGQPPHPAAPTQAAAPWPWRPPAASAPPPTGSSFRPAPATPAAESSPSASRTSPAGWSAQGKVRGEPGPATEKAALPTSRPVAGATTGPWHGLAASPGRARGQARKLAGLDDLGRVQAGDILVVRSPDPFFAVAFPFAAGLAAETGALLSHGAIAAREYRLPAVLAVPGLWDAVGDGDLLDIDGATGTVHRHGRGSDAEPVGQGSRPGS